MPGTWSHYWYKGRTGLRREPGRTVVSADHRSPSAEVDRPTTCPLTHPQIREDQWHPKKYSILVRLRLSFSSFWRAELTISN